MGFINGHLISKKMSVRNIIFISSAAFIIAVLLTTGLICSPYKYDEEKGRAIIQVSIDIDRSADEVFTYLGNSANAEDWSVFVDHISTLNSDKVADGAVGSVRRCYQNPDETEGMVWDEEILERIDGQYRKLNVFNMKGFSIQAGGLLTEQIYTEKGSNSCELALNLYFEAESPGFWNELKMNIASYKVHRIFEQNLERIKYYNE